ncbi:MAG: hypothetical protein SGPRY_003531, partial [Prymnesium sp.]
MGGFTSRLHSSKPFYASSHPKTVRLSPRGLLSRVRPTGLVLQGAARLSASLPVQDQRLSITAAARTQPAAGKNQDRFVLAAPSASSLLAGIFDGHSLHSNAAGQNHAEAAARHLASDLWARTSKLLEAGESEALDRSVACEARYKAEVATTLEREKARLEKEIGEEVDLQLPQEGGTTATITLLHKGRLLVAWVGDSRALLGVRAPKEGRVDEGGVQVVALTKDHNLADEAERSRLVEAGGKP